MRFRAAGLEAHCRLVFVDRLRHTAGERRKRIRQIVVDIRMIRIDA